MDDANQAAAYLETVRRSLSALINSVLAYFRLVLVLDGVDMVASPPLTAATGPRKLEMFEVAASRGDRRSSLKRSTDPFYNPPKALWWLPSEVPPGLHLVFGVRDDGPTWLALHERTWTRECVRVDSLPPPAAAALVQYALRRGNTDPAWGHNHALFARTLLEDEFTAESVEAMAKCMQSPGVMAPAVSSSRGGGSGDANKVVESLASLAPTAGESIRVRVRCRIIVAVAPPSTHPHPHTLANSCGRLLRSRLCARVARLVLQLVTARFMIQGDAFVHELREKHNALRNPLYIRLQTALLCLSSAFPGGRGGL